MQVAVRFFLFPTDWSVAGVFIWRKPLNMRVSFISLNRQPYTFIMVKLLIVQFEFCWVHEIEAPGGAPKGKPPDAWL